MSWPSLYYSLEPAGARSGGFPCMFLSRKRNVESLQQRLGFVVRLGRRYEDDVHPADVRHLVVLDLREDDLLFDAHGEVASAIEALARRDAAEVTHTGQRD